MVLPLRVPEGLIPAGAGKTGVKTMSLSSIQAHPRGGGENRPPGEHGRADAGSSPRGRGKRTRIGESSTCPRLIPAGAGKTARAGVGSLVIWAHPRGGGENLAVDVAVREGGGSSPRGRGKHRITHNRTGKVGLIPAWAGKTCRPWSPTKPKRAHPRVGGENDAAARSSLVPAGSSPRGRGKRSRRECAEARGGLIPAGAGKTRCQTR